MPTDRSNELTAALMALALGASGHAMADPEGAAGIRGGPGKVAFMRLFQRLDADEDGRLQADEFEVPVERRLQPVDADEDGSVTRAEMTAFHQRLAAERTDEFFARHDTDRDDIVTIEEIREQRFALLDDNQDGEISRDEFARGEGPRGKRGRLRGERKRWMMRGPRH